MKNSELAGEAVVEEFFLDPALIDTYYVFYTFTFLNTSRRLDQQMRETCKLIHLSTDPVRSDLKKETITSNNKYYAYISLNITYL